jgi:glutathione S-transferase
MKLYYSPGACSMSPHIVLHESGLPFTLEKVDLRAKKTETGASYIAICPKGQVPALQLDSGEILTEGPAIVQYIADRAPAKKLAPAAGTLQRYRLFEWLNFISTELHKSHTPLFRSALPDEYKQTLLQNIADRYSYVAQQIEGKDYLLGDTFTVADAYLFTILGWASHVGIDLSRWPTLQAYQQRISARPSVQTVLKAEGLIK